MRVLRLINGPRPNSLFCLPITLFLLPVFLSFSLPLLTLALSLTPCLSLSSSLHARTLSLHLVLCSIISMLLPCSKHYVLCVCVCVGTVHCVSAASVCIFHSTGRSHSCASVDSMRSDMWPICCIDEVICFLVCLSHLFPFLSQ